MLILFTQSFKCLLLSEDHKLYREGDHRKAYQAGGRAEGTTKRTEVLREEMNRKFDEMNKRITDLVHIANTMMVVFGGLVVAMMGLVLWDRKTLIEKAKEVTVRHI